MKIDADFRATRTLPNGRTITLRLLAHGDREQLRQAYEQLSAASRYLRFHGSGPKLTEEVLDKLMDVDGMDRLAIVATTESHDLKTERGLGIARFIRLEGEPDVAEAAVTVADEAQGQGVGRVLLETLAEAARERSIRAFRGSVLASNEVMRHLIDEVGAVVQNDDGEAAVFDVPVGEPEPERPGEPDLLFRLLRVIARYVATLPPPPPMPRR